MSAPGSLRARIVLAALAGLLLIGAVTGAVLLAAVERDGRGAVDDELRERVQQVGGPGRGRGGGRGGPRGGGGPGGLRDAFPGRSAGPRPAPGGLLTGSGAFTQVALGGAVVDQRGDVPAGTPAPPAADGFRTLELGGDPWRTLTLTLDRVRGLRLQVAQTLAPVEERVAAVRRLVVGLGVAALVLTALVTWLITTVALRPLARLREGAERISGAEDLATPLAEGDGPDEVRSVAGALNAMLARLRGSADRTERALLATRRFAADAGHELRTPLTGLRANLETLSRNPGLPDAERAALVGDALATQDRMVRLLEGLQALARGEAAESLPREPLDLGDLVDGAVFAARRRHPGTTFAFADAAAPPAVVHGWEGGVRLVVDNLLDNAARHGRPGGEVDVRLAREGGALVVRVEDDGPGLPADERDAVLAPFARGRAAAAAGTGLGLAIVAQQVALHGGTLALGDAPAGGLAVTVRLPEAPAAVAVARLPAQPGV